jgi:hypothetical protein
MNERVIEAALAGMDEAYRLNPELRDLEAVRAAIRAADLARAKDVTAAVDRYGTAERFLAYGVAGSGRDLDEARAAVAERKRELLALLGIEDAP